MAVGPVTALVAAIFDVIMIVLNSPLDTLAIISLSP